MRAPDTNPTSALDRASAIEVLHTPMKAVSGKFIVLYAFADIVSWLAVLPVMDILLPLQIASLDPGNKVSNLAVINAIGGCFALVMGPIAGLLSDRTTSRWGRRRPWLIWPTLCATIPLALMATTHLYTLLIAEWVMLSICVYAWKAALAAIIPDQVPETQRAKFSAIAGIAGPLSGVIGAILVGYILKSPQISYYIILALFLLGTLVFALTLHDEPLAKTAIQPFSLKTLAAGFWVNPLTFPNFGWAWLTRFVVYLGYGAGVSYLLYYLQDVIHYQKLFPGQTVAQGVSTTQTIFTIFSIVCSLVSGYLSDKLQRRRVFAIGACIGTAIGLLLLAAFPFWFVVLAVMVIFGISIGAYTTVDFALITQVITSPGARGKEMGIFSMALALAQVGAPLIGALMLNTTHTYALLFVITAIIVSLGGLGMVRLKGVH